MGRAARYDAYFEQFYTLAGLGKPYDIKNKHKNINNKTRNILNETNQMFNYDEEKLPETIDKRDLEFLLQTLGYAIICKVNGNWYALDGSLGGTPNPNYRPTLAIVANTALNYSATLEIGKDCVVIMNDATYQGLLPIISYYTTELVENELSLHMANINTRIQTLLSAGDNNTLESAKEFLKKLEDGELGVITEPKFEELLGLKATDYAGTGATKALIDLIEYHQYLEGQCKSKLGVRAPFNMKREALGDSEVSQMDMTLLPLIDNMLYCRRKGFEQVKDLFGEDWGEITLGSAWENIHKEVEHMEEVQDEELTEDETTEEVKEEEVIEEKEDKEDEKKETE